jgi:hypothetical protein
VASLWLLVSFSLLLFQLQLSIGQALLVVSLQLFLLVELPGLLLLFVPVMLRSDQQGLKQVFAVRIVAAMMTLQVQLFVFVGEVVAQRHLFLRYRVKETAQQVVQARALCEDTLHIHVAGLLSLHFCVKSRGYKKSRDFLSSRINPPPG